MEPGVSVVIPAYNEGENLPALLAELGPPLESLGRPYEIVLVDDGSSDATREVLAGLTGRYPALRVVRFRRNAGQSAAFLAGFVVAVSSAASSTSLASCVFIICRSERSWQAILRVLRTGSAKPQTRPKRQSTAWKSMEAEFEDRGERRACSFWSLPSAESDDPATFVGLGEYAATSPTSPELKASLSQHLCAARVSCTARRCGTAAA